MQEKDDFETLRLLYVAVTRAKSHLHLLGHMKMNQEGDLAPLSRSLLSVLWPACSESFTHGARVADPDSTEVSQPLVLKRLPIEWQAPVMAKALVASQDTTRQASSDGHYSDEAVKSRLTEEGRVIGVVVHAWLERIASDGLAVWSSVALEAQFEKYKEQLNVQGIPQSRLEVCAATVLNCLLNSLDSPRGRWVLGSQREAACELALNGIVEGQLIRATIDRTFVDEDNIRWIVDYKTSRPGKGMDAELFVSNELERYQGQLKLYKELVEHLYSGLPVRTALYFPLFDGWAESECSSVFNKNNGPG